MKQKPYSFAESVVDRYLRWFYHQERIEEEQQAYQQMLDDLLGR